VTSRTGGLCDHDGLPASSGEDDATRRPQFGRRDILEELLSSIERNDMHLRRAALLGARLSVLSTAQAVEPTRCV
jgi:hypothetical protein